MKICKECQFADTKTLQGPQGLFVGLVCNHNECRDVLEGNAMPCLIARQHNEYCGFAARFFKKRENAPEDAQIISIVKP